MDKRIREGLDACRAGTGDLDSPELAEVAKAVEQDVATREARRVIEQWDVAITAAMDDLAVPADLQARLLAHLAATENAPAAKVELPAAAPRSNRRRWLWAIASGLAATVLVALTVQWLRPASELPLEAIAEQWQSQLGDRWQVIEQAPRDFPVPEAITVPPAGWQAIGKFPTSRVLAYRLDHPRAGTATLFVTRVTRANLPGAPPEKPQWSSGGKSVGYWQSNGLMYVLVAPEGRGYRSFVRTSTVPLA